MTNIRMMVNSCRFEVLMLLIDHMMMSCLIIMSTTEGIPYHLIIVFILNLHGQFTIHLITLLLLLLFGFFLWDLVLIIRTSCYI